MTQDQSYEDAIASVKVLMRQRDAARAEAARLRIDHQLVYMSAGGPFVQAVCRCGAFLSETGCASYPAMLAGHIRAALAEPTE